MLRLVHEGASYRFPRMCAFDAHWANNLIAPIALAGRRKAAPAGDEPAAWVTELLSVAAELSETEVARLLAVTVGVAERQDEAGEGEDAAGGAAWRRVWDGERNMPLVPDLDGVEALRLMAAIVACNLRRFWNYEPIEFSRTGRGADYSLVELPDNLDFLMLPVRRKMLTYDRLLDGTVDLLDIALLNDVLAVEAENAARAQAAAKSD